MLKGLEKAVARSKYEEDVLINNHTVSASRPPEGGSIACILTAELLLHVLSLYKRRCRESGVCVFILVRYRLHTDDTKGGHVFLFRFNRNCVLSTDKLLF